MKHLPNILTALRLFMIPLFIFEYFRVPVAAAAIFALACLTDIADGYLARKYSVISVFGTLFDPAADKLLQISAVICLYLSSSIPFFVMVAVTAKELIMMLGALMLLGRKIVIPSNKAGKIGTVIVSVMIISFIAFRQSLKPFEFLLSAALLVTASASLISYFTVFVRTVIRKNRHNSKSNKI